MKKMLVLMISVASIFSSYTLSAKPAETEVSGRIQAAFTKAFTGAQDVKWYSDDANTYTAKFTINTSKVTAYFDKEGKLLSTRRIITADQLPLTVSVALQQRYPGQKVYGITEFEKDGALNYYITLEGEKHWTIVKANVDGDLNVHQRLKKA